LIEGNRNFGSSSAGDRGHASRLEGDIRTQPDSLEGVLRHQSGIGKTALLEAASLLRSGRRVLITGMGASMFASMPLHSYLLSRGIDSVLIEAGEMLHYGHVAFRDDVVVMVSRSGESVEVAKLLAILQDRQPIIGVSNEPGSLLSQRSDISLHIGSMSDEMVAVQTYTGTLVALYLLSQALEDRLETARADVAALLPALAQMIADGFDESQSWRDFLRDRAPVYLLGRGPSLASAREGALLFNEIAKSAAVGMEAASFRHGPVEVVDQSFRGIFFVPDGPTRDLNLALSRDIVRFGGQLRIIGAADATTHSDMVWCNVPACPEMLAPLFQIVPVQIAAFTLATMRGVVPGSFRFTPQVAKDESNFRPG
jgi:glucosamine--fructose-6-phosphate aminotransferase (isomerizing)